MTRIGIYRYRVHGTQLERIQPIALNGRDFVDEWLQSPWSDAARWSAAETVPNLQQTHEQLDKLRDADDSPLLNFGPVRGCIGSKTHFQVELDQNRVDGKGTSRPGPIAYFQIE